MKKTYPQVLPGTCSGHIGPLTPLWGMGVVLEALKMLKTDTGSALPSGS